MLALPLERLLTQFTAQDLRRERKITTAAKSFNFCSNDYLDLCSHPEVIRAYIQAANQYGLGSGASAIVSGYTAPHQQVEEQFAAFLGRDQALLFNSGYHANLGVIPSLADRHSIIIADKFCHASIIDGIVLSRASCKRYRHQDLLHAERLLQEARQKNPRADIFIATESVFSIQGDLTDLQHLAFLAKKYHAHLFVDDAHGIGVLGQQGKGAIEHFQLSQDDLPYLITPLGKAVGGFGAIVSGSAAMIDGLLQSARSYRYSTALPPAICSALSSALKIMTEERWRHAQLLDLIHYFIQEACARRLTLISEDITPIKSIVIGNNRKTVAIQAALAKHGYAVSCIRPPTVAAHGACIRLSINIAQTKPQISYLLDLLADHAAAKN